MGCISPQFHVKLDPVLDTLRQEMLNSLWQVKTHFILPQNQSNNNGKHRCDDLEVVQVPQIPVNDDIYMVTH